MKLGLDSGRGNTRLVVCMNDGSVQVLPSAKTEGSTLRRAKEGLEKIRELYPDQAEWQIGITGAGADELGKLLGIAPMLEQEAWVVALGQFCPEARTIFQMGLNGQHYVAVGKFTDGRMYVGDYYDGNRCAAGSGMFVDYMADNLNFPDMESFIEAALGSKKVSDLSGRCVAFTKSDIVHKYQEGDTREMIAAGIMQAAALNFQTAIVGKRPVEDTVVLLGGVSLNRAVHANMQKLFEREIVVPQYSCEMGAIGSAMKAETSINLAEAIGKLDEELARPFDYKGLPRLVLAQTEYNVLPIEKTTYPYLVTRGLPKRLERVAIGVDVGSTSVKSAIFTEHEGKLLLIGHDYGRTNGDPVTATRMTMARANSHLVDQDYEIGEIVVGTTGSGRFLTGDFLGASLSIDEISAQAAGITYFFPDADTAFELGGEDGKILNLYEEVLTRSAMNKACSAGTGTFFERIAKMLGLPIEEFGRIALEGDKPVPLDETCTVFGERSMLYFQSHNIDIRNLAAGICLAMVKNFIYRNMGDCVVGEKVVFTGAPGFNVGLVAAYETVLGKKIWVPPLPHLTGPIGAARIAYYNQDEPEARFVGFDELEHGEYKRGSIVCKKPDCGNRCHINTGQRGDGPTYFYGDRCGMHSEKQKKNKGAHLEDLFAVRERMLMEACAKGDPNGIEVGVPRGLMFSEYAPLYTGFLAGLGLKPVISDQTTTKIVNLGRENAMGDLCFPFKVAHGHALDLVEAGQKIIFLPSVHETEQPNSNMRQSHTCPYIQGAADLMPSYLRLDERGVQVVSPTLHFNRPVKHLERQFIKAGKELGKSARQSKRALNLGLEALKAFREKVDEYAKDVIVKQPKDQTAIVVAGRPYTLWDPISNMDIGKRIREMGVQAIPQDFLPLESADISDTWPNAYSRQIAKKLMAARIIKSDPRFRAIVLTYFACGPDSFGNDFFQREIGEASYTIQIDEHTADAGVITRIQSFVRTVKDQRKQLLPVERKIRSQETPLSEVGDRTIYIPNLNDSARVLAAALQGFGFKSEPIPRAPLEYLEKARKLIPGDVCVPTLFTIADMLYLIDQPDFDASTVAFMQGRSEGPCRFGMYSMLMRLILDQLGLEQIPVVALGRGNEKAGLGLFFPLVVLDGILTHDLLFKMLTKVRPYEKKKGEADGIFDIMMGQLVNVVKSHPARIEENKVDGFTGTDHLAGYVMVLEMAQKIFNSIECRPGWRQEKRPLIGIVGEFYVRLHDGSNEDALREIENAGGEVWLAPESEFFTYISKLCERLAWDRIKDGMRSRDRIKEYVGSRFNNWLIDRHEEALYEAALPLLEDRYDIPAAEVIEKAGSYTRYDFGGETPCSLGKAEDLVERGACGIVNLYPFNCMPSNTAKAHLENLRRRHNGIPILNMDFNGTPDLGRSGKCRAFLAQARAWDEANHSRPIKTKKS